MRILKVESTWGINDYNDAIFFVILEIFLDAFCFFTIPVFAIFINSEFNLGKNFKASAFCFLSIKLFIFFKAFLYLLFRVLFTIVCLVILLILLIADLVFAIIEGCITWDCESVNQIINYFWQLLQKNEDLFEIYIFFIIPLQFILLHFECSRW